MRVHAKLFLMQERQLVLESTVVLSETGGNRMLEFACYYCVIIYDMCSPII